MDIVERLRLRIYTSENETALTDEAADKIERLRRDVNRMASLAIDNAKDTERAIRYREALQFYSSFADALPHENIAPLMIDRGNKARAALKEGE